MIVTPPSQSVCKGRRALWGGGGTDNGTSLRGSGADPRGGSLRSSGRPRRAAGGGGSGGTRTRAMGGENIGGGEEERERGGRGCAMATWCNRGEGGLSIAGGGDGGDPNPPPTPFFWCAKHHGGGWLGPGHPAKAARWVGSPASAFGTPGTGGMGGDRWPVAGGPAALPLDDDEGAADAAPVRRDVHAPDGGWGARGTSRGGGWRGVRADPHPLSRTLTTSREA